VPQISQADRDGWLRNVQAVHAICASAGAGAGAGDGAGEAGGGTDAGAGVPPLGPGVAPLGPGVAVRLGGRLIPLLIEYATPQSAHLAPGDTLAPGDRGFAKPHTPHVQLPCGSGAGGGAGGGAGVEVVGEVGGGEVGGAVGAGPRTTMTFGLERMKPA
jgi:hypothetical protein